MTYKETLDYLYSQLPMYQRIGTAAYRADLGNTIAICNLLDHPYRNFRSIHIAGTNGKGSTAHMTASVLQEEGYKVGLYTSPHLKDFRERVKINGHMIPEREVIDFVQQYKTDFEKIQPSFFEMTVGLAFWYFEREKVDIAVIEVGMGGRLDSTNVITPLVSVITNIGYDHMQFLGDTLEKIAFEKAGIIKKDIPVVIGETQAETEPVFRQFAKECAAPVYFADQLIQKHEYTTDLAGNYQVSNIKTVLQTLNIINTAGISVSEGATRKGLGKVVKNTGLMGRWQTLSTEPLTICDTGHNREGINYILRQIASTPHHHLHFVFGMVSDKDPGKVLEMLPKNATYYFCKADIPRAMDTETLLTYALQHSLTGRPYPSVKEALEAARQQAAPNDLVFVGGSTFVVAEVL